MLEVSVLGPVEVRRDGAEVAVPAGRSADVLVRLALEGGRAVPVDRLIDDVWDGEVGTARNTLQSKVSQLRRALGNPAALTLGPAGYALHADVVDVDEVAALAARASAAARAGDHHACADLADRALVRFRGEVLPDAGQAAWVAPHRTRLEELQLGLVEDQMVARVALGGGVDTVAELRRLVEQHPLRERLWSALVTALYRSARQAEALATYARVRALLAEELGVEPGPALRRLEAQILHQSPALGGAATPALPTPGNLPSIGSELVGRSTDLAALEQLLRERRLVTVTGTAGVGKTRTAVEAGRRTAAPAGVWLVRLDAVPAGEDVTRAVAETLQVSGGAAALVERLSSPGTLLLLDNCEHVVDAVAALVVTLLAGAPGLRVLATSQLPLGLDGEAVHGLAPLSAGEAESLFVERAMQVRPGAIASTDGGDVERLCAALDGLPLAIELAAARTRSLSVADIARRLDEQPLALLQDPNSRAPQRRRALGAAIGWAYDLLFPDDQRGLWALSVFAGGAPTVAAEHVLAALDVPRETTLDVIDRLVERSLVTVDTDPLGGAPRLRLLDSIRAYASDRLAATGLEEVAGRAHAGWWAEVAERCAREVRGPGQSRVLDVVRADRANVDAALAWSGAHDPLLGLRIAADLGWAWVVLGDGVAGAQRLRDALATAGSAAEPGAAVRALLVAGWLEASAGNVAQAQDDLDRAADLLDDADEAGRADRHRHTAFLRIQQGRPVEVVAETAAALDLDRRLGRGWEVAASLLLASYGSIMLGDTRAASARATEALDLLSPLDDSWGMVHARGMLGAIAQAERRFDDAATELAAAAAESERNGFLGQAALHLTRLGRVEQQRGDRSAAVATLDRAIAAAHRDGDQRIAATARTTLARVLRSRGELLPALALLQQNEAWYAGSGGDGALLTQALLAAVARESGSPGPDLALVLAAAEAAGDGEAQLGAYDALARAAAEAGDQAGAVALLARADELHEGLRHLVDDADRPDAIAARAALPGAASRQD
ncbi:Predicted ATPase [Pedococcus dokdonensis]|uniref:Predicted ATPase n=1 Tax=Pedococcus dokdonensis TaxID=443156 RepID=A0A1H0MMT0_9MICO|nr:BTAD domain-containing putative transcriptional regulator [Pedococcus dokdonensis]SDO81687.1 Predicted ATPase [Pedococcus dokdonensis]